MLISFREAADLSLQIAIAVAVVVFGTSIAAVTASSKQTPQPVLDVSRPVLWESEPARIDHRQPLLTITVRPARTTDGQAANALCSDAIGLRIDCDLVAASRRPS